MDFRYLKVFMDAADTLNFAATAKNQKIAPSAVTRQIQLFEESVGEPLFIRSNQRVILTEKGREILALTRPLREWQKENRRRTVRVAGLPAALELHFWPKIVQSEIAKTVNLDVIEAVSAVAIRLLEEGDVDMAIVNRKEESSLVSYFSLATESFALISKEKISVEDVASRTWIYGESGDALRQISGVRGEHPFIKTGSIQRILDLVESGAGIAVVPDSAHLKSRKVKRVGLSLRPKQLFLALPNFQKMPPHLDLVYKLLVR